MLLLIGNILQQEFFRLLVAERAVLKLLRTIGNEEYHTRELLNLLGEWGYGHKLLVKAHNLGLIEREKVKPEGKGNWRVYNRLTSKGIRLVKLADHMSV